MIINHIKPNVESSELLEEKLFSIDDLGMIFDILRNKMYSNPILAVCREISCNARDAHREVGKSELPIVIHLPNSIEPYYKVKDFGPGISPDRIENVFIRYTASTKRNDNTQLGGFGIGSKTPFSYTDSFSITTNVEGTQYHYTCFIDETKVGKISLMHSAPTLLPNGTEIQVPVLTKNFAEFAVWTEQACRHWEIKPIIKGGTIDWKNQETILQGKNWLITKHLYNDQFLQIIIDGIEYSLDTNILQKYTSTKIITECRGNLLLYFDIGELSLSANREQIYLDERTQGLLRGRLEAITAELKDQMINQLDALPNLWQASLFYQHALQSVFHEWKFLGSISWRGITLSTDYNYLYVDCPVYTFTKGGKYRGGRFKEYSDPNKLTSSIQKSLSFVSGGQLYLNDLGLTNITPRHVRKAFTDDPTLATLQVICPTDKCTLSVLNDKIHLDLLDPIPLSRLTKAVVSPRHRTSSESRLLVFKWDGLLFRQSSYTALEEDEHQKVLCLLTKVEGIRHAILVKNKPSLSNNDLNYLVGLNPDLTFYGVDIETSSKRIKEDLTEMIPLDHLVKKLLKQHSQINFLELKAFESFYQGYSDLSINQQIRSLIKDTQSLFLNRFLVEEKMNNFQRDKKLNHLLQLYQAVNGDFSEDQVKHFISQHPEIDLNKISKDFEARYPLLEYISSYHYREIVPYIANYINLIDKEYYNATN
jgi:hypothetical protein